MIFELLISTALALDSNYPDLKLTPGVTREVSKAVLCTAGSTKDARAVSEATKAEVFSRYGFIKGKFKPGDYEIDHFVSLELGGANDIENLWPQHYCPPKTDPLKTDCWGARSKDVVETGLHREICRGEITVEEAQRRIKSDWIAEYRRIKTQRKKRK